MLFSRILVYSLGMMINFFGVALVIYSTLGTGFWSALFVGLSENVALTAGFWYGLFQFIFIFVNARLMGARPEVAALIPLVLESFVYDFWLEVVFGGLNMAAAPFYMQLGMFSGGLLAIGLGVALYILPMFPRAPVDQLFLAVSERFNIGLGISQTIVAAGAATAGLLVGGPVGWGTLVITVLLGPVIQFWHEKLVFIFPEFHEQAIANAETVEAGSEYTPETVN
ncbi:hypothetical protein B0H94_108121 [Salsuginibacillus halophilus]|uniref:Membrane protein YczE n=1 Tax=Salsuginibacillus halophilus TaxID=517424 RepID=A0A2P8HE61_9BACI|nr:hypothetical protein [Salsuginibacillus halophilus]PSL44509.1 hypothetical protein B0H94_108121 [Salsuginibacillus halophilus]